MTTTFPDLARELMTRHYFVQEQEIRRMLGFWVSGLEPCIAYDQDHRLLGLTFDAPVGSTPPIVIKAFEP